MTRKPFERFVSTLLLNKVQCSSDIVLLSSLYWFEVWQDSFRSRIPVRIGQVGTYLESLDRYRKHEVDGFESDWLSSADPTIISNWMDRCFFYLNVKKIWINSFPLKIPAVGKLISLVSWCKKFLPTGFIIESNLWHIKVIFFFLSIVCLQSSKTGIFLWIVNWFLSVYQNSWYLNR